MTSDDNRSGGSGPSGAGDGGHEQGDRPGDGGAHPSRTGNDGGDSPSGEQASGDDGGGSSLGRRIGIALLALLLTVSVAGASALAVGQGTVLSSDYVTETMGEEGAFAELESTAEEVVVDESGSSLGGSGVVPDPDATLEGAIDDLVTESYVRDEVSRNLENLYDYLHGRVDELVLFIDTEPLTSNVADALEAEIESLPVADILQQSPIEGAFSQFNVDTQQIGEAIEDEAAFNDLRDRVQRGLEAQNVSPEEVNQSLREATNLGDATPALRDSVYRLEETVVWGLTSEVSHDAFRAELQDARAEFADAAGAYAQEQVQSQVSDTIDLTEGIRQNDRQTLDQAAGYVQLADTLALAFPLAALVLLGLLLWLTHSIGRTALYLGGSLAVVGLVDLLVGFVAGDLATDTVREAVAGGEQWVVSTVIGLVDGIFAAFTQQGLLLLVVGVVLIALAVALRRYEPAQVPADWR